MRRHFIKELRFLNRFRFRGKGRREKEILGCLGAVVGKQRNRMHCGWQPEG